MPKASVPAEHGFLNTRRRALAWISLAIACAVLIVGGVATLVTLGAKSAAAEVSHPGIVRISLETQLTERAVYPPGIAQGNFDAPTRWQPCTSPASLPATRLPFGEEQRVP